MRIGITGIGGFLGGAVYKSLDENGHSVVSLEPITRKEFSAKKVEKSNFPDFDWVLHFGSKTSILDSQNDPFTTYSSNISATLSAMKVAEKTNSGFLFMSSFVYGTPQYTPIDEKHPVGASNPYMSSKIVAEEICTQISRSKYIPLIILRGFNIYGDKLIPGRLISDLLIAKDKNVCLTINDPDPKRDYLYIKDFIDLIAIIVEKIPIHSGLYNVGYGEAHSNLEVANLFRSLIGERRKVRVSGEKRQRDILDCSINTQLVKEIFSWSPKFSLKQGLSDLLT